VFVLQTLFAADKNFPKWFFPVHFDFIYFQNSKHYKRTMTLYFF
jgi:hypothetical protein